MPDGETTPPKKDKRHEARRLALAVLFGWSFISNDTEKALEQSREALGCEAADWGLARLLIRGVVDNLETLDSLIQSAAPEWPLSQVAKVDLIALRISVLELAILRDVPPKVAIDEGIELAKEFGGDNAGKFVNGVLGTIVKNLNLKVEGKKK